MQILAQRKNCLFHIGNASGLLVARKRRGRGADCHADAARAVDSDFQGGRAAARRLYLFTGWRCGGGCFPSSANNTPPRPQARGPTPAAPGPEEISTDIPSRTADDSTLFTLFYSPRLKGRHSTSGASMPGGTAGRESRTQDGSSPSLPRGAGLPPFPRQGTGNRPHLGATETSA